jgi:hypothetical protein
VYLEELVNITGSESIWKEIDYAAVRERPRAKGAGEGVTMLF